MVLIEESNLEERQPEKLEFFGQGSTYFGIVAMNVVLTILTIGLYYPWAKAAYRKYLWNETEFKGSRFVFNGTGKEMFKGFLIAYGIFIGFYISFSTIAFISYSWMFAILFYILLLLLIPFAIYGAWRYRVTRTSWRGIFFSFDGDFKTFIKLFIPGAFLTLITLGIYSAWFRVKIQKFLFSNTRLGNLKLDFHGDGGELFGINIIGGILLYPTLFLYVPIWLKNRFNFTINYTTIQDENKRKRLRSTLENGEAWKVLVVNGLMLIFTLGLAYPWTFMRKMKLYFDHVEIPEEIDYDNLEQAETDLRDASGDEMLDILDMGIDF